MEIKVKDVSGVDSKSVQEVENELLEKHEQETSEEVNESSGETSSESNDESAVEQEIEQKDLNEEDVLSYINSRYDRKIDTVEQLFEAREESEEMPEDVSAYLKFKKETGRGINDFIKVNRDLENIDQDQLLKEYLLATEVGLDEEDVESMMEDYSFDEDLDDERVIKKAKLAKKKAIAKAKEFFKSEKEKYSTPLESKGSAISDEEKEKLEAYNQYVQKATSYEQEVKRKQEWFLKKTDEVFGNEFKGFEFNVEEGKNVVFSPADAAELKKVQSDSQNFINKFLDDSGLIQDAVGYHKALSIAMNPEKFAKFFYEQGKSASTDEVMRKMKNTDMGDRRTPEVTKQGGTQIRAVNPDSGRGLKIKSRKK
jgi:hypothetical protein